MMTSQVVNLADIGQISQPDIPLNEVLRLEVVPDFLEDVGYVSWRRLSASLPIVAGTQEYNLPTDFGQMHHIALQASEARLKDSDLTYIGDNPELRLKADAATARAKPTGWYFVRDTTVGVQRRIRFDAPPDAAYTARYTYYTIIPFLDGAGVFDPNLDVNLDLYIPLKFQRALIEGLKRKIYAVRFGMGDNRYIAAMQEYGKIVSQAISNLEQAGSATPRFCE